MCLLVFGEIDFSQTTFVENPNGCSIVNGALNVVDVNVIAEDGFSILVVGFNGRAGKADERSVFEGVVQMLGEAVNKIVLAAVRFVGNDNNVSPEAERFVTRDLLRLACL